MIPDYRNILIVRTDRIGDVVLSTPTIAAVRANFPNARITVLISLSTVDLMEGNPNIDAIMVDDRGKAHKGVFKFWRLVGEIRQKNFDAAIILHTKRRTNLLCFLAGIKNRIGYRDKNYGFLLTQGFADDRHLGKKHEIQYSLDLLKSMGLRVDEPKSFLPSQPSAENWVRDWLKEKNIDRERLVAIHPSASDPTRCWPLESFAKLIDELVGSFGCRVVVFGAGNTVDLARELKSLCVHPFFDLTGQTSIAQTVSLLRQSRLLISNDSGPVHIGAAAGIFVIAIFLRNQPGINPERWKPFGPKGFVIVNKHQEVIRVDGSGRIISGARDAIKPEEVARLAQDLLKRP